MLYFIQFLQEDPGFFKNLLQELAQKEYACLPAYVTTRSGPPHNPIFSSAVEINEESFTGQEAKTKKLAEMNAAKVAYIVLKERKILCNSFWQIKDLIAFKIVILYS